MGIYYKHRSRNDLVNTAVGIIAETTQQHEASGTNNPASGVLLGALVGLRAGETVSNLSVMISNVGASVTLIKLGLYNKEGTSLLASTASFHATLAQGVNTIAVTTPYVVPADDAYAIVGVSVAGTNVTWRVAGATAVALNGFGSGMGRAFQQTGQTDLPASITKAAAANMLWAAAS